MQKPGIHCHHPTYRGYGDISHGLMRIGIAPGATEIEQGRPFVGPTGQLLRSVSDAVGWPNDHAYDTNMICNFNNTPAPHELEACRPRLLAEISIYKPKLIVLFGKVPATELLGKDARRGWLYQRTFEDHQCYVMWTYHPSAILQGGNHFVYDLYRDMQKIPIILKGKGLDSSLTNDTWPPRLNLEQPFILIDSVVEAQEALDSFQAGERVALDIETRFHDPNSDDYDVYTDDLICLSVSNGYRTYVFTRQACGASRVEKPHLKSELDWPKDVAWTYHNSPFDRAGLRKYLGADLPVVHDTMYMSAGRDEYNGTATFKRGGQNKLESLTAEYFADTAYKDTTKKSWRKHIEPLAHDLYLRNANDAFYTWHLVPVMDSLGVQPAYESLVLPAARAYTDIMLRGCYVDTQAKTALAKEWGAAYAKLYAEVVKVGIKNPSSRKQLSEYIYSPIDQGGLGMEGGPSTAKAVIKEFDHPFTNNLIQMGNIKYLLDHWIFGIDKHIKPDGRIHPNIILHGPETGRRAAHDPPVQTIPKHGERLHRIRELFKATNDDYCIMECDYSQAEMFVAAYLSEDDELLKDLITPPPGWDKPDVHLATALRIGAIELLGKDNGRQAGKTLNFLMLYGGGVNKFHSTLQARGVNVSLALCNEIIYKWRNSYSKFNKWCDSIWQMACDEGYLITPFGRIRRFPLILDPQWRSQVINFPVQSTAGDYTLDSLVKLHPLLKPLDCHILFDIHDSIVMECSKKNLQEAQKIVVEVMEQPKVGLGSIKVDIKVGPHL